MISLAARTACRITKSVKSVLSKATARISSAFSSARILNDIRLLSSTAIRGISGLPFSCTHSKSTSNGGQSQSFLILVDPERAVERPRPHHHCFTPLILERIERLHLKLLKIPYIPSRNNQPMHDFDLGFESHFARPNQSQRRRTEVSATTRSLLAVFIFERPSRLIPQLPVVRVYRCPQRRFR